MSFLFLTFTLFVLQMTFTGWQLSFNFPRSGLFSYSTWRVLGFYAAKFTHLFYWDQISQHYMEVILQSKTVKTLASIFRGGLAGQWVPVFLLSTSRHSWHSGKKHFLKLIFILSFMHAWNGLYSFPSFIIPTSLRNTSFQKARSLLHAFCVCV